MFMFCQYNPILIRNLPPQRTDCLKGRDHKASVGHLHRSSCGRGKILIIGEKINAVKAKGCSSFVPVVNNL